MSQPFLYYYIGQGECQTVQWHVKNVLHSCAFDLTYVFVVWDWFVLGIWQERLFLVVMQTHLGNSFFGLWKHYDSTRYLYYIVLYYIVLTSYPQNPNQTLIMQNKMPGHFILKFLLNTMILRINNRRKVLLIQWYIKCLLDISETLLCLLT